MQMPFSCGCVLTGAQNGNLLRGCQEGKVNGIPPGGRVARVAQNLDFHENHGFTGKNGRFDAP
jgi:hypothetical protein